MLTPRTGARIWLDGEFVIYCMGLEELSVEYGLPTTFIQPIAFHKIHYCVALLNVRNPPIFPRRSTLSYWPTQYPSISPSPSYLTEQEGETERGEASYYSSRSIHAFTPLSTTSNATSRDRARNSWGVIMHSRTCTPPINAFNFATRFSSELSSPDTPCGFSTLL